MNRRTFVKTSVGAAIGASLIGCNATNTEALINVIIAAAQAVVKVADPSAFWLTDFNAAIASLQQAEATWKGGSTIDIVESALNTLAAVSADIPVTAQYSPLIDIIVAGINSVLSVIAPQAITPKASIANPHLHRVTIKNPSTFETRQSAFKKQFNQTAEQIGLPQAKI